jgi:hypothetical protein
MRLLEDFPANDQPVLAHPEFLALVIHSLDHFYLGSIVHTCTTEYMLDWLIQPRECIALSISWLFISVILMMPGVRILAAVRPTNSAVHHGAYGN